MALVCSLPTSLDSDFSFLDCGTINISMDIRGLSTVSFTVVSTSKTINLNSYTTVSFGSNTSVRTAGIFSAGRVTYKGIIVSYELSTIPGTIVYEHRLQLLAWGCKS